MSSNSTSCQNVYDVFLAMCSTELNVTNVRWNSEQPLQCSTSTLKPKGEGTVIHRLARASVCDPGQTNTRHLNRSCQFNAAARSTVSVTHICTVCIFLCSAVIQLAREHHCRELSFHAETDWKRMHVWLQKPAGDRPKEIKSVSMRTDDQAHLRWNKIDICYPHQMEVAIKKKKQVCCILLWESVRNRQWDIQYSGSHFGAPFSFVLYTAENPWTDMIFLYFVRFCFATV